MFGGGMRQAGILAAACIYSLNEHIERLYYDHDNANYLAKNLYSFPEISIDMETVQTNMVNIKINHSSLAITEIIEKLYEQNVLIYSTMPDTLRAVTHLNVSKNDIDSTISAFHAVLAS